MLGQFLKPVCLFSDSFKSGNSSIYKPYLFLLQSSLFYTDVLSTLAYFGSRKLTEWDRKINFFGTGTLVSYWH